jgi:hypothetical protein
MKWYTIVINNVRYSPEMVSAFENQRISVVRIFQRGEDLVIEIFITGWVLNAKATIQKIIQSFQLDGQPIQFTLSEGVEYHSSQDTGLYRGDHAGDDILYCYYEPVPSLEGPDGSLVARNYYIIVITVLMVAALLSPLYSKSMQYYSKDLVWLIILVVWFFLTLRKLPFTIKLMADGIQIVTLLGKTKIEYHSIHFVRIRPSRGWHAMTVKYEELEFVFPIELPSVSSKARNMVATIIQKADLVIVFGESRDICSFGRIKECKDEFAE